VLGQQGLRTVGKIDRKEIAGSGNVAAAVVCHVCMIAMGID